MMTGRKPAHRLESAQVVVNKEHITNHTALIIGKARKNQTNK